MKTESEIKGMLKHCTDSNGMVSPTVIDTLQWVLSLKTDEECQRLLHLSVEK